MSWNSVLLKIFRMCRDIYNGLKRFVVKSSEKNNTFVSLNYLLQMLWYLQVPLTSHKSMVHRLRKITLYDSNHTKKEGEWNDTVNYFLEETFNI